jgi:hypothetical protein
MVGSPKTVAATVRLPADGIIRQPREHAVDFPGGVQAGSWYRLRAWRTLGAVRRPDVLYFIYF